MDRRTALRTILGAAAVATGGSMLLPQTAQALPGATALPGLDVTPTPAVATEADVAAARVQNVWHWGRPHRRVVVVRPGWGGPVVVVRRRRRRCWINRWGNTVCAW